MENRHLWSSRRRVSSTIGFVLPRTTFKLAGIAGLTED
jgi:hypothetical protein